MKSMYKNVSRGANYRLSKALLRLALSWTDGYVEPDIDYPEFGIDTETHGYIIYNDAVYECDSYVTKHMIHQDTGYTLVKRHPRKLYSKKIDALKSLRSILEERYARTLLEIDDLISNEMLSKKEEV